MTTLLHVAAGNGYGGIERMLAALAGVCHHRLHQEFVVCFEGRLDRELRAAGAVVHRLPSPRAARPLAVLRARRAFAAVLAHTPSAVVVSHGAWPHAMFASEARRAGRPLGFWQHQPVDHPAWPDRWARRVRPDFTVFNSAFTSMRPAFPHVPGRVIHCPVAEPPPMTAGERQDLRRHLGASFDDVVVLMAARFEAWKGHHVLLDAVEMLPDARLRVWIAGGPQRAVERRYHDALAERAAAPRLRGRVSLLGERDDVLRLTRLADAYCQPNLKGEPFGIAIAEAMRAGLPCVISSAGSASELADEHTALVTPPGDADAVAHALQRLLDEPALRDALGTAAAAHAARLTDSAGRLDDLAEIVEAHAP